MLDSRRPVSERLRAAVDALRFYSAHVPALFWPFVGKSNVRPFGSELRTIARLSRKLARRLLGALARFGPKLDRQQLVLGRLVEAAAELMGMSAAVSRAAHLIEAGHDDDKVLDPTVRFLCKHSSERVESLLHNVARPSDRLGYRLARRVMDQE